MSAQSTTGFTAWKDAKNADAVPGMVSRMLTRDFQNLTGTDREELLAKNLSALTEIASDSDVVPSTRYNAMLAIGQLEMSPGPPPVAYPAALTVLVDVYQNEDSPDYIKYGALLGIVRHALCGIETDQQDKIIHLLLETVTTELEPEVWHWLQQTALDGLSALRTAGTNGKIATELLSLIDTKSQELEFIYRSENTFTREHWKRSCRSIELASKAAKTLGDFDYKSASGMDAKKMTDTLVRLTKTVCDVERKMATDAIEQKETSPDPAKLLEQIVLNTKICTQSVIWGGRSTPLTGKPGENSFYASLDTDNPAIKRWDVLLAETVELTTFFDEGTKSRRSAAAANVPKEFKFDLSELRDALGKCSEALHIILDAPPLPSGEQ